MNNQYDKQGKYRSEIDGLRAFAVIAVIINHFNKDFLPSGYLGVDIFFVISGYVITSSLSFRKSKNFGDFITSFYERRIKRLVPALIVYVLLSSILICLFREDAKGSLTTGFTSLFGISNIALFWVSKDYFADSILLNPFTHTWSLGVEEQFYLLFPLITWFTGFSRQTNKGVRNFFITILFLVICSLILFIYLYPNNQPAAYFLLPTRFWEIAIGSLTFLIYKRRNYFNERLEETSPTIFCALIIGVMFLPTSLAVPSTILIVILTVLLIASLREGTLIFKFFREKNVIYIGLISYSLYLWHWGILSISRWTIGIHWWSIPFQVALIFVLAVISYEWVETPLRKKDWSSKKFKTIFKGFTAVIFSAFTLVVLGKSFGEKLYLGNNKSILTKPYFEALQISEDCYDMDFKKTYNHSRILNSCFAKIDDKANTLYLLGDSHTNSLWFGAEFISREINYSLLTFSQSGMLFPSVNYFREDLAKQTQTNMYRNFNLFEKNIISEVKEGDIFIIMNRLPYHFGKDWYSHPVSSFRFYGKNDQVVLRDSKQEYFEEWLILLAKFTKKVGKKDASVIIFTPTPEFPNAPYKQCKGQNDQWFNKFSRKNCSIPKEFFTSEKGQYTKIIRELERISSEYENLYLFDSLNVMCPQGKCKYSFEENLIYNDDNHISNYAARYVLAPEILSFIKNQKLSIVEREN